MEIWCISRTIQDHEAGINNVEYYVREVVEDNLQSSKVDPSLQLKIVSNEVICRGQRSTG